MHRVFLKLGPVTIYSYGVMMALAFLAGIFMASYNFKKNGKPKELAFDLAITVMLSSIIGARIFYVLTNMSYFMNNPSEILKVYHGGLVYYGGFIGGLIGGFIFVKIRGFSFFEIADPVSPVVSLGQAIGRIGCFLNGCCYGRATSCSLGVKFPVLHDGICRIPTQIYSSLANFLIFLFLMWRFKNQKFNGEIVADYLMSYGIFRFIIEFYRGDPRGGVYFGMFSVSQVVSLIGIALGIFLFAFMKKKTIKK
jgi:phosphatidylglycerol:prolipoprotein diacylglycerol transferase